MIPPAIARVCLPGSVRGGGVSSSGNRGETGPTNKGPAIRRIGNSWACLKRKRPRVPYAGAGIFNLLWMLTLILMFLPTPA